MIILCSWLSFKGMDERERYYAILTERDVRYTRQGKKRGNFKTSLFFKEASPFIYYLSSNNN